MPETAYQATWAISLLQANLRKSFVTVWSFEIDSLLERPDFHRGFLLCHATVEPGRNVGFWISRPWGKEGGSSMPHHHLLVHLCQCLGAGRSWHAMNTECWWWYPTVWGMAVHLWATFRVALNKQIFHRAASCTGLTVAYNDKDCDLRSQKRVKKNSTSHSSHYHSFPYVHRHRVFFFVCVFVFLFVQFFGLLCAPHVSLPGLGC